ncbi:MAG: YoaK family protein [Flavobacteriaceae bacterium]|nr:DUF1275 domain-containing protein [Mangrovimonas sp.]MCB0436530.1 DUF1275 domain-containing protein [Mangrovimonas sp.]HRV54212.1 YoaK family protein [Mangrovimonas sp.]
MFKHQGESRTLKHNIQLAILLSFVAGMVNVVGFLSIQQLTTNVTGHFALFIYDLSNLELSKGLVYFLYIFSFLLGAFVSSLLIETFRENKKMNVFAFPIIIESALLILVAILGGKNLISPNWIACLLLFAMGLQNSFVTKVSNAVVRTTHLTGLFTDLGIELSHLFFPSSTLQKQSLKATIRLRIYIISFFFLGGFVGGYIFSRWHFGFNTLLVGAAILIIALLYDDFSFRILKSARNFRQNL